MDATSPDPEEAARRLRAAIAYAKISQDKAAAILEISKATLTRMTRTKGDEFTDPTWEQLWKFADAIGVPRAWFAADLGRLYTIVPDHLPSFPNDVGDLRFAQRFAQALRLEVERDDARREDARDTKRGRRRRQDEGN